MELDKIITLANAPFRLRFVALERSLRATGCDLPLLVIPYDKRQFELPKNSSWWTIDPICQWLESEKSDPITRKYQCLTVGNYQFVDADVVFLRHPGEALAGAEGFVASCCHWNNPDHTFTTESLEVLRAKSTAWPRLVFNSGQFACDRALFTFDELKRQCHVPQHERTCLRLSYEQPAIVLLANLSGVPVSNLTLPPACMESTWAGDYVEQGYERYWQGESRKPYILHWAGCDMWVPRAVDQLFLQWLTAKERAEWDEQVAAKKTRARRERSSLRERFRRMKRGLQAFQTQMRG